MFERAIRGLQATSAEIKLILFLVTPVEVEYRYDYTPVAPVCLEYSSILHIRDSAAAMSGHPRPSVSSS